MFASGLTRVTDHDVRVTVEAPSFTPELFAFLRDLAANNDREWFAANKERYVAEVQEPALAFIEDVGMRLPEISRHFVADARTTGGSLFRIYRDTASPRTRRRTRPTPASSSATRARATSTPRLLPAPRARATSSWPAASGIPDRDTLHAIRTAIAAKPSRWQAIVEDRRSRSVSGSAASR